MSFRTNESQQISLFDCFNVLTPREQKVLLNSWAKVFAEEVFPTIDEERFSVLYSDKAWAYYNCFVIFKTRNSNRMIYKKPGNGLEIYSKRIKSCRIRYGSFLCGLQDIILS